jgi:hypothetical protein
VLRFVWLRALQLKIDKGMGVTFSMQGHGLALVASQSCVFTHRKQALRLVGEAKLMFGSNNNSLGSR